jgi:hypothetical protein
MVQSLGTTTQITKATKPKSKTSRHKKFKSEASPQPPLRLALQETLDEFRKLSAMACSKVKGMHNPAIRVRVRAFNNFIFEYLLIED